MRKILACSVFLVMVLFAGYAVASEHKNIVQEHEWRKVNGVLVDERARERVVTEVGGVPEEAFFKTQQQLRSERAARQKLEKKVDGIGQGLTTNKNRMGALEMEQTGIKQKIGSVENDTSKRLDQLENWKKQQDSLQTIQHWRISSLEDRTTKVESAITDLRDSFKIFSDWIWNEIWIAQPLQKGTSPFNWANVFMLLLLLLIVIILFTRSFPRKDKNSPPVIEMRECEWCHDQFPKGKELMTHRTNCPQRPTT